MSRAFNHDLHIVFPGNLRQRTQSFQLCELGCVIGIGNRSWPQAIAQRKTDVVGLHDVTDVLEMGVEKVLLVVGQAPLGHDRTAPGNNSRQAIGSQWNIGQTHARMDGEVVNTLLGLFNQGVAEQRPGQLFGFAMHFFKCLVDRHRADRNRRIAQNPLAGFMDILPCGQVHYGVRSPANGPHQFVHLLFNTRRHGRISDIGIDLHQKIATNRHRLDLRMVDVGGNNGAPPGYFVTDKLWRHLL